MIFAPLLASFIQLPVTIVQPYSGLRVQQCSVKTTIPQNAPILPSMRRFGQKYFKTSRVDYDFMIHNGLNVPVRRVRMELDPYIRIRGREQFAGPTTLIWFNSPIRPNQSARWHYGSSAAVNSFAILGQKITKLECFPVEAELADGRAITFFRRNVFF